jgi:hypothetical protein
MRQRTIWLSSMGLGAASAYLLDPTSGNRRRRRIGDAVVHAAHQAGDGVSTIGRDLRNRTAGILASARRTIRREWPSDVVLEERVRAALGRIVSHPHAIRVTASDGHVLLSGPRLPTDEQHRIVHAAQTVVGVKDVEMQSDIHTLPANVPSTQWSTTCPQTGPDILQRNWAPATRAALGSSGAAMVAVGLTRRDRIGLALAAAGVALVTRALTNLEFRRVLGIRAGRRAINASLP